MWIREDHGPNISSPVDSCETPRRAYTGQSESTKTDMRHVPKLEKDEVACFPTIDSIPISRLMLEAH